MNITMKLIMVAAVAVAIAAFASKGEAGSLAAQGLDDPHVRAPAVNCEALYRKYPSKPSRATARHLNHMFAPCEWPVPKRKKKTRVAPVVEETKQIEDKGGEVITVPVDHVLTEGQSE